MELYLDTSDVVAVKALSRIFPWQACINHYDDTYVYANISLARGFLS